MTSSLAGAFRASFKAIVIAFGLAVLAGAAGFFLAGGNALLAVVFAGLGLSVTVALFGFLALQIENTALLERIATALEQGAPVDQRLPAEAEDAAAPRPEAPLRRPAPPSLPAEPVLTARRSTAPQSRVEPVVTLRRNAG